MFHKRQFANIFSAAHNFNRKTYKNLFKMPRKSSFIIELPPGVFVSKINLKNIYVLIR